MTRWIFLQRERNRRDAAALVLALLTVACDSLPRAGANTPSVVADPAALVSGLSATCTVTDGAASEIGRAAALAADGHWERVPFQPSEAIASIRRGREAIACFEAAGARELRRAAAAQLLLREERLLRMIQQARRAFARAAAKEADADAERAGTQLLGLLEEDNEATNALRREVKRWLRGQLSRASAGGKAP